MDPRRACWEWESSTEEVTRGHHCCPCTTTGPRRCAPRAQVRARQQVRGRRVGPAGVRAAGQRDGGGPRRATRGAQHARVAGVGVPVVDGSRTPWRPCSSFQRSAYPRRHLPRPRDGSFIPALAIEQYRYSIHRHLALNVRAPRSRVRTHLLLLGVCGTTVFISMWIHNNTPCTVMMVQYAGFVFGPMDTNRPKGPNDVFFHIIETPQTAATPSCVTHSTQWRPLLWHQPGPARP
jgi:solute carrier family 13 (sodium-dependent dicarboxylate transporter), member 2/3/5